MRGVLLISGLISGMVLALSGLPAGAQEPAAPAEAPPADAARRAEDAAEELILTRALAQINLTPAQAARLAPTLSQAQGRLRELDNQEASALARFKSAAEAARRDALGGDATPSPVEQQLAGTSREIAARRLRMRGEQVALIRAQLTRILSPEQISQLSQAVALLRRQDRASRFTFPGGPGGFGRQPGFNGPGQRGPGGGPGRGPGAAGAPGGRGGPGRPGFGPGGFQTGGPQGFMGGLLDRVRNMTPEQWEQMRARMAGGGFGPRGQGAAPGGPAGNNPAGPGAGLLPILERARSMSPQEFAANRAALQNQLAAQAGRFAPPGAQVSDAEQLDWFIDRHLLHPVAPQVVRRRAGG